MTQEQKLEPNPSSIKLSVVIPTFNRRWLLKKTLDSCFQQKMRKNEFEVIVIDNCSTDGTREYLRKIMKRRENLRVVFLPQNMGPAAARNIGAMVAKGKYLVLLDDDSFFTTGSALKSIWQKIESMSRDVKVLAFDVVSDNEERRKGEIFNRKDRMTFTFVGAGAAIERNILRRIPFDEDFFVYGEEDDLSYRILLAGYKILFTPDIRVKHVTGKGKQDKKLRICTRNWAWIPFKYYPLPIAIIASLVDVVYVFIESLRKKVSPIPVILGATSAFLGIRRMLIKREPLNRETIDLLLRITPSDRALKIGLLKTVRFWIAFTSHFSIS
jgi:GT2 family glycosyltransferase